MKRYISQASEIMKNDLSLNVLVVAMLLYFVVMETVNGHYVQALCALLSVGMYIAGAFLGPIKKYLPIILSIIFIPVLFAAGIQFLAHKTISGGFLNVCAVMFLFSIAGYTNTTGTKCITYLAGVVGSIFVFCINQNNNGIIIGIGMLIAAIMLLDATYTAVSKYVLVWFLSLLIMKVVGIVFFLKNIKIKDGLMGLLASNEELYIVLVILGIGSLLLRERHPRIKSDRDKKHIPSLKRWQTITGITFAILFFWGILNMNDIFSMQIHDATKGVTIALLNIYVYINNFAGSFDNIFSGCGFIALFLTVAGMCAIAYKSLQNYRVTHAVEDKLLGMVMAGYIVNFTYFDFSVPMTLLWMLTAGCVVNGTALIKKEDGRN
mgnify:FL=1